jgi:hypothetical protein
MLSHVAVFAAVRDAYCMDEAGIVDSSESHGRAECCQIWTVGLSAARCDTQPRRITTEVAFSGAVE